MTVWLDMLCVEWNVREKNSLQVVRVVMQNFWSNLQVLQQVAQVCFSQHFVQRARRWYRDSLQVFWWLVATWVFSSLMVVCSNCLYADLSTAERVFAEVFIYYLQWFMYWLRLCCNLWYCIGIFYCVLWRDCCWGVCVEQFCDSNLKHSETWTTEEQGWVTPAKSV